MTENMQLTDIVIITALNKEKDAILNYVETSEEIKIKSRIYYKATISSKDKGSNWNVVILCLSQMGNVEASIATTQAIDEWNPRYIMLVGIAAGIKGDNQFLGDIVVAEQIVGYEPGKLTDKGVKRRYDVLRPANILLQAARNLSLQQWVFSIKSKRPDGSSDRVNPLVHFGVVASGEKVVAVDDLAQELKESWTKLIAIEMESYGMALAAYKADTVPGVLMIKGVCDWADPSKNDTWQEYAADVAATYTIALLKASFVESSTNVQATKEQVVSYGKIKTQVCQRLDDDWQDLANYFDIPLYKRNTFPKGEEPRKIWEWLENRNKLSALKEGLEAIKRHDLANLLDEFNQNPQ